MKHPTGTTAERATNTAIAPRQYWDRLWKTQGREPLFKHWSVDPLISGFDRFLGQNKHLQPLPQGSLLEIGCGGSNWLSYFAQRWDNRVEGIDYSDEGCRLTQDILSRDNVQGIIHHYDFFHPPDRLIGKFDTVISAGVLEHFLETGSCLKALQSFLKPSGRLITIVPNLTGLAGKLIRVLTPEIYSMHLPLTREGLIGVFRREHMPILWCDYFLPFNFGVINLSTLRPRFLRRVIGDLGNLLSRAISRIAYVVRRPLTSRRFSPYILAVTENR